MSSRHIAKLVHDGCYAAEVDVTLIETDHEWSPCFSLEDAMKLDRVRDALKNGDRAADSREVRCSNCGPSRGRNTIQPLARIILTNAPALWRDFPRGGR